MVFNLLINFYERQLSHQEISNQYKGHHHQSYNRYRLLSKLSDFYPENFQLIQIILKLNTITLYNHKLNQTNLITQISKTIQIKKITQILQKLNQIDTCHAHSAVDL